MKFTPSIYDSVEALNKVAADILKANGGLVSSTGMYLMAVSDDGRRYVEARRDVCNDGGFFLNGGWSIAYGKIAVHYVKEEDKIVADRLTYTRCLRIDGWEVPASVRYKKEILPIIRDINVRKNGIFSEAIKKLEKSIK